MCVALGFGNGTMDYGLLPVKNLTVNSYQAQGWGGWLLFICQQFNSKFWIVTFENGRMA